MRYKLTVTDDVLRIAHKAQLEKYDRVDALLPAVAIMILGQWIKKVKFQYTFQSSVKIALGYPFAQLETGEQLFLVFLFSLHT